jgi:hypothetical protein
MSFLAGIGDLLKQYSAAGVPAASRFGNAGAGSERQPSGRRSSYLARADTRPFDHRSRKRSLCSTPVLIKSLGAAALTIAMKKIADSHAA